MKIDEAVSRDKDILGNTLCFRGTRVPVRNLFDYLEGGQSINSFLESFDWIAREMVLTVLHHSIDCLETLQLPAES